MRHLFYCIVSFSLLSAPTLAAVELENESWRISVDPETLAIAVAVTDQEPVVLSSGFTPRIAQKIQVSDKAASWHWGEEGYTLSIALEGQDLRLSVQAERAATLDLIAQPAAAMGQGLILPLAEGHYVSAASEQWRNFVAEHLSPVNTSQDLSLPLLGMDFEAYSLTWIFETPFNNTLSFARENNGLSVGFSHEFTTLAPQEPVRLLLHLGSGEKIAGAKRYRRLLIENSRYESLESKIAATPDTTKLLGASHIYFWGNGLLGSKDVVDWQAFASQLKGDTPIAKALSAGFDKDVMQAVNTPPIQTYEKRLILHAVNQGLHRLARQEWQVDNPNWTEMTAIYERIGREVHAAFGAALSHEPALWGATLSKATFEMLGKAGLTKAWIGLGDGWEGGLWNPQAVAAGVSAGYLIAPYDSYETAIPAGVRPDWTTAALGKTAYEKCAVIKKDGKAKSGFNGSGHYTLSDCTLPILKERVQAIKNIVPYNSWFLDAYATGMVFDSYRPSAPVTMKQNAQANEDASRWVNSRFDMPVASEDGNATTAGGIALAHGMQVPVIGWGDRDMMTDRQSPYYLGRWYPEEEPEFFFKQVPVKEPFRSVYFDPSTRLPLYQSVFHGSVITTNHWHFDSLKFTNTRREAELVQLLYNVPPLYHLNERTMAKRLPIILRQQAFFQPLHERLGTSELVSFHSLSNDRLLQETSFSEGTRLIANMSQKKRSAAGTTIAPFSIIAVRDGAVIARYTSRD